MQTEREKFVIGTIRGAGCYWNGAPEGYRSGDGHKGVRLKVFEGFFKHAYGANADAHAAVNEQIKAGKVLAVLIERRQTEYERERSKSHIHSIEVGRNVRKAENPMLYMLDNLPRPIAVKLERMSAVDRYVKKLLTQARA